MIWILPYVIIIMLMHVMNYCVQLQLSLRRNLKAHDLRIRVLERKGIWTEYLFSQIGNIKYLFS